MLDRLSHVFRVVVGQLIFPERLGLVDRDFRRLRLIVNTRLGEAITSCSVCSLSPCGLFFQEEIDRQIRSPGTENDTRNTAVTQNEIFLNEKQAETRTAVGMHGWKKSYFEIGRT